MKMLVAGPGDRQILYNLCANRREYEKYYNNVKSETAVGDCSPSYLYFSETSMRIRNELGKPKIILVVRNPIEKAYSQYMHLVRDNREDLKFYDALMAEEKRIKEGRAVMWRYAESSLYSEKTKKYIDVFGKDHVKVILFDDLLRSTHIVIRDIFQFLGVDANFQPDTAKIYNRSGMPRSKAIANLLTNSVINRVGMRIIPEKIRTTIRSILLELNTGKKDKIDGKSEAYLREYFYQDVKELEKIIGRKLDWFK